MKMKMRMKMKMKMMKVGDDDGYLVMKAIYIVYIVIKVMIVERSDDL